MSETEFIELAVRYLDGAASEADVERLGAAMVDRTELRRLYRDLAQQMQLTHELGTVSSNEVSTGAVPRRRSSGRNCDGSSRSGGRGDRAD